MWTGWPTEGVGAMANITPAQVLEQVDALTPNQYAKAEKLRWLAQAEGFVLREIRRETGALPALADDTPLTVEPPYDELYRHYVEAQIHYCNGEMARYNSAAANWNNALLTYRDYVCRTTAPVQGVRALKLC